ncbi:hypothetical protein [Streptomyces kronopolitis]|uniref:hypothetical protein n=1 Tax=Streptomyces kronopolitis TaxID=1612435 RepID=UPI00342C00AE
MSGLSAYVGLTEISGLCAGETVFVSGAAGAVPVRTQLAEAAPDGIDVYFEARISSPPGSSGGEHSTQLSAAEEQYDADQGEPAGALLDLWRIESRAPGHSPTHQTR